MSEQAGQVEQDWQKIKPAIHPGWSIYRLGSFKVSLPTDIGDTILRDHDNLLAVALRELRQAVGALNADKAAGRRDASLQELADWVAQNHGTLQHLQADWDQVTSELDTALQQLKAAEADTAKLREDSKRLMQSTAEILEINERQKEELKQAHEHHALMLRDPQAVYAHLVVAGDIHEARIKELKAEAATFRALVKRGLEEVGRSMFPIHGAPTLRQWYDDADAALKDREANANP